MPASVLSAFLTFTIITAFTPGPNNILAFSSGTQYGLKRSAPIIAGSCTGFLCVMAICGLAVITASTISDQFVTWMRYIGTIYIIWLAWKVAFPAPQNTTTGNNSLGFTRGFILQFVNIKIIIYGLTAFSGFIIPHYNSDIAILSFVIILSIIGNAGVITWAILGFALQKIFQSHAVVINAIMGIMLIACAISMVV